MLRSMVVASVPVREPQIEARGLDVGWTFLMWLAVGFGYSWLGLARWARGDAQNYDLGIFTQIAKDWSEGRLPAPPLKGASAFGDHFSPITALFGVAYRVWPDPRSLIILQALTVALAVVVLAWYAAKRLERTRYGIAIGVLAALSLPMIAPVIFEVHEVALGVPAVAVLAIAVHEGRWRPAVISALVVLTVKEDLGLMVAAAGVAWWIDHRQGARALTLVGLGGAATIAAQLLIVYAHPEHRSPYVRHLVNDDAAASLLQPERLVPILVFLALSGLAVRPVTLLAAPVLAWRVLSSNPHYWQVNLHYDVVLAPIAVVVLIDLLRRHGVGAQGARPYSLRVWVAVLAASATVIAGVAHTFSQRPWSEMPWSSSPVYEAARSLTAEVPRGSSIIADNRLGPPLIPDYDIVMLSDGKPAQARWVLLDMRKDSQEAPLCAKEKWLATQPSVTTQDQIALVDLGQPQDFALPHC